MDQQLLENISSPEIQAFIRANDKADPKTLALQQPTFFGLPAAMIADQIAGRKKAKEKIPTFYDNTIIYPPGINLEQSSSEQTAIFKTRIILESLQQRRTLIDLTGGFGVDSYFLSKVFKAVHYVEPHKGLFEIVVRNHNLLSTSNIVHHNTTAEDFLALGQQSDAIFIDPSRRNSTRKVFAFADCEPNMVSLQAEIFKTSDFLLVKASPLLDLKSGIKDLTFVKKVFVVSVNSEVKELLFLCMNGFVGEPMIEAVNLSNTASQSFSFTFSEEAMSGVNFSDPMIYLYEPNPSILKAGAFKSIAQNFNLAKIQANTHLYTSDTLINDFPGRIFKVLAYIKADKKSVQQFFADGKANVTTRNYPLSADELRKKLALKDGGEKFVIGFSGVSRKFLVVAERIRDSG
jgi:hypothetical protein